MSKHTTKRQPQQPIIKHEKKFCFLENKIIIALLEEFGVDEFMNILFSQKSDYTIEDYQQFFQLIGMDCKYYLASKEFSDKSKNQVRKRIIQIEK